MNDNPSSASAPAAPLAPGAAPSLAPGAAPLAAPQAHAAGITPAASNRLTTPLFIAYACGSVTALVGALVLLGWYTHNNHLLQINSAWVPMSYNTALGFFFVGIGLIATCRRQRALPLVAAAYTLVIGGLTLIEHLGNCDLGIDQILMRAYNSVQNVHPGRMALNTDICFLCCGVAFCFLKPNKRRPVNSLLVGLLGTMVATFGAISLIGYLTDSEGMYSWVSWINFSRMAAHTSIAFISIGLGLASYDIALERRSNSPPPWLPLAMCAGISGITVVLWQALLTQDLRNYTLLSHDGYKPSQLPTAVLVCGLLLATLSALIVRLGQTAVTRARALNDVNARLLIEIEDRQQAQARLLDSDSRYRAAAEGSFDSFFILDCVRDEAGQIADYSYRDVNTRGAALTGHTREGLIGTKLSDVYHPSNRDIYFWQFKQVVEEKVALDQEVKTSGDGVDATWARIQIVPLADGIAVTYSDITERKRDEIRIHTFAAELERSNRELQEFATIASHDLQEPLRKIQTFGDRLNTKFAASLPDEGRDYLARMQDAAQRMSGLINDLLALSRVTTQGRSFNKVDLNTVAREVLGDMETYLEHTDGVVEIGALPVIEADATQMRQLLQNIIGNALKYHREDVPPTIRLSCESTREGIARLEVHDNGIGFEPKYIDRIFTVFQRLHTKREYEGSGIGLAICRKIVERHGGSITAQSTPGQGSVFLIDLPLRQSARAESQAADK